MSPWRVVVVDNRDSFVHTLAGYVRDLGAETIMIAADDPGLPDLAVRDAQAILVSPGPGHPDDAGHSVAVVHAALGAGIPLLGVCLGHQAIATAFGGRVGHAPELLHGITSVIRHGGDGVFADLPDAFVATRYHSLSVDAESLPAELEVTARTDAGVVMGLRHRTASIEGVQFHPESVLTEGGHVLLGRWLENAGLSGAAVRGSRLHPRGVRRPNTPSA
ncbi:MULTISPECIES: aminodeoxychorismate/anthranilate synthase component II [Microbacterium]|uniref:Para-aminobenzoate synthetase component 2 n=1 Tax=Microbacterium testaceum (strain StLB037) TaxID=979556 RepID=A0A1H0M8G9_MICTS|nr:MULTISPECIES: gamma-glutamyl-gamma-aminobutyrate hydrolase family protein [Microbacterium]KQM39505.1 para-aminobenzoate synthase [Microbacterium sp. Leaf203]SDO76591.1 para-aminobenzoate synthetase component 2 [Microbacterium testaceum StLB037]